MNYILAITLFFIDLLAANIFNAFIIQTLLIATIFKIAKNKDINGLIFVCILLSLESFIELGELYFIPVIPLLLFQIFQDIRYQFNIIEASACTMLICYNLTKLILRAVYVHKLGMLFTSCQLFVNISLLIGIFFITFVMKNKGRLSSRFYRW